MSDTKENPELTRVKRIIRSMLDRTEDRGCSEAEAMEAAAKVGALLEQYDLSLDEVMLREEMAKCITKEVYASNEAAGSIIVGLSRLCTLRVYHKSGSSPVTYVLFGTRQDIDIAVYLYSICMEAVDHDWVLDQQRTGVSTRKAAESFRMGFSVRVCDRLVELRHERDEAARKRAVMSGCTDLVVLKDQLVEQEWEQQGIRLRRAKAARVTDYGAYHRGAESGDRVNLNNPLEDGSARAAGLL